MTRNTQQHSSKSVSSKRMTTRTTVVCDKLWVDGVGTMSSIKSPTQSFEAVTALYIKMALEARGYVTDDVIATRLVRVDDDGVSAVYDTCYLDDVEGRMEIGGVRVWIAQGRMAAEYLPHRD